MPEEREEGTAEPVGEDPDVVDPEGDDPDDLGGMHREPLAEGPTRTDAMGLDKHRQVVGKTYGPTKLRILATFATFFAIVGALAVGFYLLAKDLDQPPEKNKDAAPWAAPEARQTPSKPIQ